MEQELAVLENIVRRQDKSYHGKYRAFVHDNADPERRGRLQLIIPSVLGGEPTDWALPCFPYGGGADFGFLAVPPNDSQVVAEFLEGDLSSPIWTGSFWRSDAEVPEEVAAEDAPTTKILKTESGHYLALEDKEGETHLTLHSSADAVIEMDDKGSIALTGSDGAVVILDAENGELTVKDASGNSLVLSSSGIEARDGSGNIISTSSGGIEVKGTTIKIEGQQVTLGGAGAEPLIKGQTFLGLFNAHTHVCTAPGAPTGPPVPPLTPAVLTIATKAS